MKGATRKINRLFELKRKQDYDGLASFLYKLEYEEGGVLITGFLRTCSHCELGPIWRAIIKSVKDISISLPIIQPIFATIELVMKENSDNFVIGEVSKMWMNIGAWEMIQFLTREIKENEPLNSAARKIHLSVSFLSQEEKNGLIKKIKSGLKQTKEDSSSYWIYIRSIYSLLLTEVACE